MKGRSVQMQQISAARHEPCRLCQSRHRSPAGLDLALIVLDIGLPAMDGLEVCRHIRARSQVPSLFFSARKDEVDLILALELGADGYVTKPFSPRELLARIRAIVKHSLPRKWHCGNRRIL